MTLSIAMAAAVHAIRHTAASLEVISRRPGWRVETATNRRGELAIAVLVPPERLGEWDTERRANVRQLVSHGQLPPPAAIVADQIARIGSNRGLANRLDVYWHTVKHRDVWIYELSIVAPDAIEQRRLKNHR